MRGGRVWVSFGSLLAADGIKLRTSIALNDEPDVAVAMTPRGPALPTARDREARKATCGAGFARGALLPFLPGYPVTATSTPPPLRSEERRVGKECVRTCSSRGSPNHSHIKTPTRRQSYTNLIILILYITFRIR